MITIKYVVRPFLKKNGQVAIRVRWNSKQSEVTFITGKYAELEKWNLDRHCAMKNTTHHVRKMTFTASEINDCIADFRECIDDVFNIYALKNCVPSPLELKQLVNEQLGRDGKDTKKSTKVESLPELFARFVEEEKRRRNWDYRCVEKYRQAFTHFTKANPKIGVDGITQESMFNLKDWYVQNNYKNETINHRFIVLKTFFKWLNANVPGKPVPEVVLNFSTNFKDPDHSITFMLYDELLHFASFEFDNKRLSRARDLWCFMAFTSLRYSDLANLQIGHIQGNQIHMMTQKTSEYINIPLTDGANAILDKYKGKETADGHIFDVPSNPKLNDAIKDAAKAAGLDRVLVKTNFIGKRRIEKHLKLHEILSCHDARRTFVTCSLAMGISPQTVMKCTGHSDYDTMKPYIETTTETQALEMERWNRSKCRSEIIKLMDGMDESKLEEVRDFCLLMGKRNNVLNDSQPPKNG